MGRPRTARSILATTCLSIVTVLGIALFGPEPAMAGPRATGPTMPQTGPANRREVGAFLDDLLAKEMETQHIAGAAVSVVKDGRLLFEKGYGYADLKNRVRVDPDMTNFRIGSLAKLFTWTAVMQLAEQGKLNLDADVNDYLDFPIPPTYPEPITLKHLMTHTAGFEDLYFERLAKDSADLLPPREWLISHMPARVHPPGQIPAYSSYGAALAGYIVSRVSGEPFASYVQRHILDPLGMVHTTAQPSMPPDIRAHTSLGYTYADGAYKESPDPSALKGASLPYADMGQPALVPAGDMQSSAADMARFMIAQLREGPDDSAAAGEPRLLKEATLRRMHQTLYTPDPQILGTAYGFFDFTDNGQRTIGHSGGSDPIFSQLLLVPDQHLGIFVAYNSSNGEDLTLQHLGFQRAFFDHYYPTQAVQPIQPSASFAERAGQFVGTYRITGGTPGTSYTTTEKAGGILGIDTVQIGNPHDGSLLFTNPWGKWRFIEERPLYFRQVDAPFHIQFREDRAGHVTDMFTDYTPMWAFEKLRWYETPGFSMALVLCCIVLFLSAIVTGVVRLITSRRRGPVRTSSATGARVAYGIVLAVSALNLLLVLGTMIWFNPVPVFGIPAVYKLVLGLGVVAAVLSLGLLVYILPVWRLRYWGLPTRIHYTAVTVGAVAFVWFLNYWNLLGWRYHPQ